MALSRKMMHDMFRILEEPITRADFGFGRNALFNGFNRPALGVGFSRPALDVREEGDKYVLEAELPGVRKDNIEVRIGDAGKSVTIEGRVIESRGEPQNGESTKVAEAGADTSSAVTNAVATDEVGNQISSERSFVHNTSFRRTVWLPRPVDGEDVAAKLDHGILTITVKKAQDKGSVVVPVE
ncbi:hypothetical protein H0H93_004311 [Arthromyces matolae]|nr:hypothetical protein H0H93_004311 [Arthromyces matolae]